MLAHLPSPALLLFLLLALGCGETQSPEQPTSPGQPVTTEVGLPPAVKTPGPGADAYELRRREIVRELRGLVAELEDEGRYGCCVEVSCSHCALMAGGCKCAEGLRRGEPVCEECALMWAAGKGSVEGVEASSVRSFLEAKKGCSCGHDGEEAGAQEPEADAVHGH